MYRIMLAGIFAFAAVCGNALAQTPDPAWLDDMNFQIAAEKECEVAYIVSMREGTLGGEHTFEARVQCEDGRMFDASRIGEFSPFTFKLCGTQVC